MAWRLNESVVRGEIDNRERGRVRGRLWLLGRGEPIRLELAGNCWRDLAGCLLTFENSKPRAGDKTDLSAEQHGTVGDMTASRKVRVLDVSVGKALRLTKQGKKAPEHKGNCLYLEWFSEANGRLVIESTDYRIQVSAPMWTITAAQEREQVETNRAAMEIWMERLAETLEGSQDYEWEEEKPLNEFEWEKKLRESDELTERFCRAFDKYADHPNRDELIEREMGWDQKEESFEKTEFKGWEIPDEVFQNPPPLVPNPLTEGTDWIRDGEGHVAHPLSHLSFIGAVAIMNTARDRGWLERDEAVREMVFQFQMTGAKMAGALDGLAYEEQPDGGLIVACLKRALHHLHWAIAASHQAERNSLADRQWLQDSRNAMFALREGILTQMKRFREEEK